MIKYINLCIFHGKPIFSAETAILIMLLEYMDPISFEVYLDSSRKKEILKVSGMSKATYYRAFTKLIQGGIISECEGKVTIECCKKLKANGELPVLFKS